MSLTFDTSELNDIIAWITAMVGKLPDIQRARLEYIGEKFVAIEKGIVDEIRYTGELADSIGYEVQKKNTEVEIGPNVPGGNVPEAKIWGVWKGAGARWIPVSKLSGWTARKFPAMNPEILQMRIAGVLNAPGGTSNWQVMQHGTQDFPFPERTMESDAAQGVLDQAVEDIAAAIEKELQ